MKEIINISRREFLHIRKSKSLMTLCFVLPIVLSVFFALIYKNEIVREVPIGILDEDDTMLSRKIIQMIESSPSVRIDKYFGSYADLKISLKKNIVQAAFYFPKDFEKNVKSSQRSTIVFYKNSSNILLNNIVYEAGLTALKTASAGILLKKIKSDLKTSRQAMFVANPIRIESHLLFNPNYSYSFYLVPGFVLFTLQMIILISTVSALNSEYNVDKFADILKFSTSPLKIIIGKIAAYSVVHLISGSTILLVILPFANIHTIHVFPQLFLLLFLFTLANITIAMMISTLVKNKMFSTEIIVFVNTPAFILSGYTFPLESMPRFHFYFAQFLPFTHFLSALIKTYQMKLGFGNVQHEIILFSVMIITSILVATFGLWNSLNKLRAN